MLQSPCGLFVAWPISLCGGLSAASSCAVSLPRDRIGAPCRRSPLWFEQVAAWAPLLSARRSEQMSGVGSVTTLPQPQGMSVIQARPLGADWQVAAPFSRQSCQGQLCASGSQLRFTLGRRQAPSSILELTALPQVEETASFIEQVAHGDNDGRRLAGGHARRRYLRFALTL